MATYGPNDKTYCGPLTSKPDMPEAARRWDAWFAGEMLDRPIVCVTAPLPGGHQMKWPGYRERAFGDIDEAIELQMQYVESTYWGGEATPGINLSLGPDECAVFCGAGLAWSEDSGDTNWSVASVEDWEEALPLRLHDDNAYLQRLLALYRRAGELALGKALLVMPDLHTNMDLLSGLRGPQRLCMDLLDMPELIDRAMDSARAIFPQLWDLCWEAGNISEVGLAPTTTLQCDFSCMMSPEMFRRWVLPALEEEAEICGHVTYHWDGPGAIVHTPDLATSQGLGALDYVPGAGAGSHIDYLDLFKRVQSYGKAVSVWGGADEVKAIARELRPELTIFHTWVATPQEADELLEWFVRHT